MTGDDSSSTHPPLPPTTEDDRLNRLRLLRSRRVGPATYYRMIAEHGSAAAALDALPEVARAAGVAQYQPCPEGVIRAEMRAAAQAGARLVTVGEAAYPATLAEIEDAPPLFWCLGELSLLQKPMVALVGARNASSLGTRMAASLAKGLGEAGYVVVSGLARGIDAAAHDAALGTGTVAVQAGGVDVIYPPQNAALAGRIGRDGLRLSEQPMGLAPQARHFPARNRIISGLARAVVVVEAAARSGSLITARTALDQGRDVLAVPGHPFDGRAAGGNMLIRDGARLIRGVDDVLEVLGEVQEVRQPALPLIVPPTPAPAPPAATAAPGRSLRHADALHQQILERLGPSPLAEDQLLRDLDAPQAKVSPILLDLELTGRIERQPGGLLARTA